MTDREVVIRSMQDVLNEEGAKNRMEAFDSGLDVAKRPGGLYVVGGVTVDANGNPVKAGPSDEEKAEAARLADEKKAEAKRLADEKKAEAKRLADEAKNPATPAETPSTPVVRPDENAPGD